MKDMLRKEGAYKDIRSLKAKGGAVTVRNGVINTKKVSKKDKNTGKYIPDTVTVKCGKITKIINVIVEE